MKRHLPFITASVLCLPFSVLVLIYLVALTFKCANASIPDILTIPIITGLFWISDWSLIELFILTLVSTSVVVALFQEGKTRIEVIFNSIYSVIMLVYLGLALWIHVTKPVWDL